MGLNARSSIAALALSAASLVLSSEFGILIGILLGVGGLAVNWYYCAKQDRGEQAEHERRMRGG